jgi:cytoskeleton protein RodZ
MTGAKPKSPRPKPWEGANGESSSFGGWLRRQREARDISLREIVDASKISVRYLEALEEDRFDALPAPVFAKGFLREYARYVGLNPDEVVNSYLAALQIHEGEPELPAEKPRPRGSSDWAWGVLLTAGVLLLLGAVALLAFYAERRRERAPSEVGQGSLPARPPAPTTPAVDPPAVPQARAGVIVRLQFLEDCWLETQVDGAPRVAELRAQGSAMEIEAERSLLLTLGNSRGVLVEVNGVAYALPAPGRDGSVRDHRIEAAAVAAAPAADAAAPLVSPPPAGRTEVVPPAVPEPRNSTG